MTVCEAAAISPAVVTALWSSAHRVLVSVGSLCFTLILIAMETVEVHVTVKLGSAVSMQQMLKKPNWEKNRTLAEMEKKGLNLSKSLHVLLDFTGSLLMMQCSLQQGAAGLLGCQSVQPHQHQGLMCRHGWTALPSASSEHPCPAAFSVQRCYSVLSLGHGKHTAVCRPVRDVCRLWAGWMCLIPVFLKWLTFPDLGLHQFR